MKKVSFLTLAIVISQVMFGQLNVAHQEQVRFPDQNINVNTPSNSDVLISVKGLANIKADSYVAMFTVTQVGKSIKEATELMDKRITQVLKEIKQLKGTETYVDMITFVPVYEFEVEKKTQNKENYNEILTGFELKKNIHIKYFDPNQINDFITILSNQEIYDLVKVDYFASNVENIRKELRNKAKSVLKEKMEYYEDILEVSFTNKRITDGYKVMLPIEMYKSYEAFNRFYLNVKKSDNVNLVDKPTSLYYQPIVDKEFDFVINTTILEPVIQVMYEIKLLVRPEQIAKQQEQPQRKK